MHPCSVLNFSAMSHVMHPLVECQICHAAPQITKICAHHVKKLKISVQWLKFSAASQVIELVFLVTHHAPG